MPVQDGPPPPQAPVTDTAQPPPPPPPPPQAPVTDPIAKKTEREAPVSDPQRIQVGSQLAQYLLLIVGGSIIVFVLYLVALDGVTSNEVTQVYEQTFQQMRGIAIPHDASGADDAAKILQGASRFVTSPVSTADADKVRNVVEQLKKSGRLIGPNAARLDQCVQFVVKPATTAIATGAKQTTTSKKDTRGQKNETGSQDAPTPAADRAKAFDECIQILDPLRQVSASEAIDLDRLRLMKEYAKDAHDHRQAFRSFWLQAAQLVLLNLLLPLLTALLGYIFGSREH